ncbi:MAG: hypothetical protein Q4G68_14485 [Planctomycetia bacterium]|nr:hypothetical protein [Planctomycetia bacterium]
MRTMFLYGMACLAFIAMGCGGPPRPDGLPDLLPVTLVLTQEGTPFVDANVLLAPVEQTSGNWTVGGVTDDSGKAVIYTHGKYSGAPAGTYKVLLRKTKIIGAVSHDDAPKDPAGYRQWAEEHAKELAKELANQKNVSCVEKIYTDAQTTPLEITVSKGSSQFELDAGKAVEERIAWPARGRKK